MTKKKERKFKKQEKRSETVWVGHYNKIKSVNIEFEKKRIFFVREKSQLPKIIVLN